MHVADANYLDFFGIRAIEGDAAAALRRPDALVLSVSTATRLFGQPHALGKVATIDGQAFEVKAILPDLPANTSVGMDALVGVGAHSWAPPPKDPWRQSAAVYVKGAPALQASTLTGLLQDVVAREADAKLPLRMQKAAKGAHPTEIAVVRLSDVYFDPGLLASRSGQRYGSKAGVAGLGALALLILALAVANYVNLAAIRTVARQREIGMRKALGVTSRGLANQFMAESLVVAMAATVAGMAIAWLVLPLFSELVGRKLGSMLSLQALLVLLLAGAGTGVLAGVYPALLALRLPASVTLQGRGNSETAGGRRMRRTLSALQFGVAIALIATTLAVGWQTRFASRADPGFDPAPLLVVALPDSTKPAAAHAFADELKRLPGVLGAAPMSEAAGRDGFKLTSFIEQPGQAPVAVELKLVGANFFDVYRLKPVAGRLFDPAHDKAAGNVILNARAAVALGFASPEAAVGQMLGTDRRIVGIAPDVRFQTLRQQPESIVYGLDEDQKVLTVRGEGDLAALRDAIEATWSRHFPNDPPDIERAGSIFAQNYNDDLRLAKILGLASLVAATLACFGIYVLAAYSVERRAREIVLRKLHGARGRDIGKLVAREFALLMCAGALAGLPLAWLANERYLSGFVERAPMGQWPLVFAFVLITAAGIAATIRQTLHAARISPALALRD
jgi:ABC-type antimicrobial peptide transport system permease subunit